MGGTSKPQDCMISLYGGLLVVSLVQTGLIESTQLPDYVMFTLRKAPSQVLLLSSPSPFSVLSYVTVGYKDTSKV